MGSAAAHCLKPILPLLLAATAGSLGACATPTVSVVTPTAVADSPVAGEVRQASAARGAYPKFSDIPATPMDVRPASAWSQSIYDMLRLRRQMLIEAAMAPPPPSDTAVFAQQLRNKANPANADAQASSAASTTTFVEGGRERATPPSSAD
jgi:hypothetical protein